MKHILPKATPQMREAEQKSVQEIAQKYPGKQFKSPQAQRELRMAVKRNYTAAGYPEVAQQMEQGKTASLGALAARTGLGALAGGYMGYQHAKGTSDDSPKSKVVGAVTGALAGGALGAGMHGLRSLAGPASRINSDLASKTLTGMGGLGLAALAGDQGSKFTKNIRPDLYRPDYLTEQERIENVKIQDLVSQLEAAGGIYGNMDPDAALALTTMMNNPDTAARVNSAIQRRFSRTSLAKTAAYLQMYAQDQMGHSTPVPYNDPRAIQMAHSQAFQEQLKKRIALMQLQRLQEIAALQQTLTPDYRDSYADQLTEDYLAGKLRRPQPTEGQARAMINQYMSQAGVNTETSKAQRAADMYDGTPSPAAPKRKKNNTKGKKSQNQKSVRIKEEGKGKMAQLNLAEVMQLEKVAGTSFPTKYNSDGSVSKNINGVMHSYDSSGILKTAGPIDSLLARAKNLGPAKAGLGVAALTGLGYGGYKLHEYLNRDTRTGFEKTVDAINAGLPYAMQAAKVYGNLKQHIDAQNAYRGGAPVTQEGAPSYSEAQLQQLRAMQEAGMLQGQVDPMAVSQYNPYATGDMTTMYRDIY